MLKLIINADDFGLTKGCNTGIIQARKEGMATDTTLMVNMKDCPAAVKLSKDSGIHRIGLHLNLTCGRPVSDISKVRSLVDQEGNFYRRAAMLLPHIDLKEAETELWAQVEKFHETGMGLTHLDSHHHIHMHEGLTEIVIDMAKQLRVPLRQTGDLVRDKIRAKGVITTDYFTWAFYDQGATFENLCQLLEQHREGTIEIMSHPAILDNELSHVSSYSAARENELQVLTSEALQRYIQDRGIQLISFDGLVSD